jgi:hypothetical protein
MFFKISPAVEIFWSGSLKNFGKSWQHLRKGVKLYCYENPERKADKLEGRTKKMQARKLTESEKDLKNYTLVV